MTGDVAVCNSSYVYTKILFGDWQFGWVAALAGVGFWFGRRWRRA